MHWHNAYAFWGILAVDTKRKRQLNWILTDASVHIKHKKQFPSPPSGVKTIYPHNIALHSTLTKIWCQFTATKNCKQNLSWYTYNLTYKQTGWTQWQNLFTLSLLIKQKYNSYKVIDPGNPPLGAWTFSSNHVWKPWTNIHRKT